mmetsp:Transcript_6852/g.20079  ORF Transcript_6852/g.20079 Transcript_6852/m.20079 type:complete len:212 (-) Transcript_6852:298-933(-)
MIQCRHWLRRLLANVDGGDAIQQPIDGGFKFAHVLVLAILLVVKDFDLDRTSTISSAQLLHAQLRWLPLRVQVVVDPLGPVHGYPRFAAGRIGLSLHDEERIALAEHAVHVLEFQTAQLQMERAVVDLGSLRNAHKHSAAIPQLLRLDVAARPQDVADVEQGRSHGLVPFGLADRIEDAHIELGLLSELVIGGEGRRPSWVQVVLDDLRLA